MTARGPARGPELLTTAEAAEYLTMTPAALKAWRVREVGPPFIRVGSAVRYSRADLDSYLAAQRVRVD